jgi:hypothetical protein
MALHARITVSEAFASKTFPAQRPSDQKSLEGCHEISVYVDAGFCRAESSYQETLGGRLIGLTGAHTYHKGYGTKSELRHAGFTSPIRKWRCQPSAMMILMCGTASCAHDLLFHAGSLWFL